MKVTNNVDIFGKRYLYYEQDNGTKEWYLNGLCHREDGPAIEYANGFKEWHYHGKHIDCKNHQEFLRMIKLMVFL